MVASTKGGFAQVDPSSVKMFTDDESQDFLKNKSELWKNTKPLSDFAGKANEFAAIFYVGGHGPVFDLVNDATSHKVINEFWESGKIVSAVCHGPAALAEVKLNDGSYLIKDSPITAFTNAEEDQVGLSDAMPYMLETKLSQNGGKFENGGAWAEKVVIGREGRLITGQNPASATAIGKAVAQAIKA